MEGEEEVSFITSLTPPDSELMAIGSPDDLGFQEPEQSFDIAAPSSSSNEPVVLTDDLKDKIIKQVEYYFSDENLSTDKFLMSHVKKDKEGFVPVALIASFRKMKKLVRDNSLIVDALQESTQLVLSSDGKKVKRKHTLPVFEVQDAKSRTVLVENLPENFSIESIKRIFGAAGNIKNISVHDPHGAEDPTKISKAKKLISGKIHALVEYETMEGADRAVATLNDENNWRTGMRVKLLLKRMGKSGPSKKGGKASEKSRNAPISDPAGDDESLKSTNHHDETPEQEEEGHLRSERTGWRNQNRGRSKGHKQHNHNGQGHGTVHRAPGVEGSKPPPGPRMPDGTRGFAMGRGRPPVSNQNSA
ncbi:la-related protein 6A [Telopea speciosissima]|uniref:la-related protein 6A n=1 Tax=Telopea speciosissima TaxID=54955 RepID=UPI001CC3F7E8|nr:la-related protein 6A [Telopea speciosissima]